MVATPPGTHNATLSGQLGGALDAVAEQLEGASLCFGHGTDNAWDEAVLLVLSACDLPVDAGDEVLAHTITEDQGDRIRRWLHQRIEQRVPLPYLIGRAWFAGLEFHCDSRALVPRSPLAEVIQNDYAPWWSGGSPRSLLDLCCGGGAIGIAAAAYNPELRVVLADLSTEALDLAAKNVALHGLRDRVSWWQSDVFEALDGNRFDIILCNPPYVNRSDLVSMPAEYAAEPPLGLGSGEDGLDLTRRILCEAGDHLVPDGLLFLELGNSWTALDELLPGLPLTWLEFSSGGHGVLVLRTDELPAVVKGLRAS